MNPILSDQITMVITSCGRFGLLKQTIDSFLRHADILPDKTIIIENSTHPQSEEIISNIASKCNNLKIIINETNIGQIRSIDKAYQHVDTEYIFHSEDDWGFYDTGFMYQSLEVLKNVPNIVNVNLRKRFDGTRGSNHPVLPEVFKTNSNVHYYKYQSNFAVYYHGFSFNPGLRRLADYYAIGNYTQYGNEERINAFYYSHGYEGACLEKCYCCHLDDQHTTLGANT